MKSIKIACSGFPVGQKMYRARLGAVELSQMFDGLPRAATLERWREESDAKFEFIACAPEDVTHLQASAAERGHHKRGAFQNTTPVHHAFRGTVAAAAALKAKLLFVRIPRTMTAHADNVDRIMRFFKTADRGPLTVVWEPPVSWPASIVEGVSKALHFVTAMNPLSGKAPPKGPVRYFRIGAHGATGGIHSVTDAELAKIKDACHGATSYVVFNNGPRSFDDAVRFAATIY